MLKMPRPTKSEAEAACSPIRNANVPILEDVEDSLIVYTVIGLHDALDRKKNPLVIDENPVAKDRAFAYKTKVDGRDMYFLKLTSDGHIYNPVSGSNQFRHNKVRMGIAEAKWRKVNQKVFDFYLQFLRTKTVMWLSHAERELV
jgi:hypothetical protein